MTTQETRTPAQVKTGRYSIGEVLYAVCFEYKNRRNRFSTSPPFIWGDAETPAAIHFVKLTVTAHHRVPGDWDDEIKYDGYELVDDKGQVYTNQYPRASYGQLSDEGDRRFWLKSEKGVPDDLPKDFGLVREFWRNMEDGLKEVRLPEDLRALLTPFRERFLSEFEAAFPGKTLGLKPAFRGIILVGTILDKPAAESFNV